MVLEAKIKWIKVTSGSEAEPSASDCGMSLSLPNATCNATLMKHIKHRFVIGNETPD